MVHPACPELRREPQLSPPHPDDLLSLFVFGAHVAKLFAPFTFQRVTTINFCNSFFLMTIRISGGGYTGSSLSAADFLASVGGFLLLTFSIALAPSFEFLCFHALTNCQIFNSFVLTTMHQYGGLVRDHFRFHFSIFPHHEQVDVPGEISRMAGLCQNSHF